MEKVKISTVIIISVFIALWVAAAFNINRTPSKDKINEVSSFADELVSSLNSESITEFNDEKAKYDISISINEKENQSLVKVTIDNIAVSYPAKIVDGNIKIGIDYKVVKIVKYNFMQFFMFFLFCFFASFSIIIISIRILCKPKNSD